MSNGSTENYDGLCGIIALFSRSDRQIRCHYELGHGGPCSFKKLSDDTRGYSSCSSNDFARWQLNQEDGDGIKRGFIESVLNDTKVKK